MRTQYVCDWYVVVINYYNIIGKVFTPDFSSFGLLVMHVLPFVHLAFRGNATGSYIRETNGS